MNKRPKPTKSPIGFDDDHGTMVPPSWRARNKQHTAATIRTTPGASSFLNFVDSGIFRVEGSTPFRLRKKTTNVKTTPPIGKFLQSVIQKTSVVLMTGTHLQPEAPSPRDPFRQASANHRPNARKQTEKTDNYTKKYRAFLKWTHVSQNAKRSLEEPSSTQTCDGSAGDECA